MSRYSVSSCEPLRFGPPCRVLRLSTQARFDGAVVRLKVLRDASQAEFIAVGGDVANNAMRSVPFAGMPYGAGYAKARSRKLN